VVHLLPVPGGGCTTAVCDVAHPLAGKLFSSIGTGNTP
jgi:hypothetical protein